MLLSMDATPQVTADFTTLNSTTGCGSLVVEFKDLSLGNPSAWLWDFGNGNTSILENPIAVYNNPGSYDVVLKVTDGIDNDIKIISSFIIVFEKPSPLIHVNSGVDGCLPLFTSFQDITNTSSSIVSWQWDFGDGGSSNFQNPDYIYLNQGLYSVALSVIDTNGCENLVSEFDLINVYNTPEANFSADILFSCDSSELVSFSNNSLFSSEFFWNFGDGSSSNILHPTHIYYSGLHTVELVAKEGSCFDTLVISDMINIIGAVSPDFTVNTNSGCEGLSVSFSDLTNSSPNTFFWDFGDGNNSTLQNPTHIFESSGIYDVSLTTSYSGQCTSTTISSSEIEVFANPIISFEADTTLGCYMPFNVSFTNNTTDGGSWIWDFGDGNYSYLESPLNSYNNLGEFDVSLYVENNHGCFASDTFTKYITIYDNPSINFIASPLVACAGVDINFFDISFDVLDNWLWDFGNGYTDTVKNPVYQYSSTGTFDINLIAGVNSCKDTLVMSNYIKIIEPSAIFEETYNCSNPLKVEFHNFSIGSDSVFWDFGDGVTSNLQDPVHTFANLGIHTVSLSISNSITGCTHTIFKDIELTQPIAQFDYLVNASNSLSDSVGCPPKRVYLDNQSQDYSYYKVLWSDGYVGYSRIDHLFTEAGIFDVTMIVSDLHGCKDTATIYDMYHMYDINIDFGTSSVAGCDSLSVQFEDLSAHPFSSVIWDFGDGNSTNINNPYYTYNTEGVYDVKLYTESVYGCKDTLIKSNYITYLRPIASFNVDNEYICKGDSVSFSNSSFGYGMSYTWDFGDGNISYQLNPEHEFSSNGIYDVTLTVIDSFGCSNSLNISNFIQVLSPEANFSILPLSSNCPPQIANFTNLSSTDVNFFEWSFGDGSVSLIEDPTHLFSNPGLFDISLIVENAFGCTDTLVQHDAVNLSGHVPMGSFLVSDTFVCKDDDISFFPSVINVESFIWDFGDGTISTDSFPNIVYNDTGYFIPTLIVENNTGCQLIINSSDTIHVHQVTVEAGINLEICEGELVELSAVGNGSFFDWMPVTSLSEADISNPVASPNMDIMYYINSTDGFCSAVDSLFIRVYNDVPQPNFSTANHCEGEITSFLADAGLNTANNSYLWSFGQSGQTTNFCLDLGINTVNLVVENLDNSCKDTVVQDIVIFSNPIADFMFLSNEFCLGDSIVFINNASSNTVTWNYDFGDSVGSSVVSSPVYTYLNTGVFSVVLNIESDMGCSSSVIKDIIVNELPNVDFLVENKCENIGNTFINLSSVINGNIAFSQYNFPDGFTSNDSIAHYIFDGHGLFDVSLEVISSSGCKSTSVKTVEVFPNPHVNFSCSQFCEGDLTIFNNLSLVDHSEISSYRWNFGLEDYSSEENPEYTFLSSGLYDVTLSLTSLQGCESKLTKKVEIYSLPSPLFEITSESCVGVENDISYVQDLDFPKVVKWSYSFGDGCYSDKRDPTHLFNHVGSFDVGLEVVSLDGCKSDTILYDVIEVYPFPIVDFQVSSFAESELNSEISFFNNSSGAEFFEWNFDDGYYSNEKNPIHTFNSPEVYNVSLNAINQFGCSSLAYQTIQINPEYTFFIPDAFSPDGDGLNDTFQPKGDRISSFNMKVFDRWGGILFESSDINYGWDGTNNEGLKLNKGVYLYNVSLYDLNNRLWIYNGELNLMR